ncbi:UDP-N-acetylmuramate dehydrogenase [bacterium]|nr:UDP-N-acetylmuramate dehydrogenase [bacterium]
MHIAQDVPLAEKNWFCTGGKARFYAEPTTADAFAQALAFARERDLPVLVLGEGANMLVSDAGFAGLVIRPQLGEISFQGDLVTAGSGVSMPSLIEVCLANNRIGLEEFSGIPGTVGGSVYINIHYFQFLLHHFLVSARVICAKTGAVSEVDNAWFNFGYDTSRLLAKEHFLIDATFKLKHVEPLQSAFARGRSVEIIRHRRQRYPYANTCGSFFRNFHAQEVPFEVQGKKICFVAYYLESVGVKGSLRVGNAVVSHQHANMLVTEPGATSDHVVQLARTMQQRVFERFGIVPQPECQLVGFDAYPLMG